MIDALLTATGSQRETVRDGSLEVLISLMLALGIPSVVDARFRDLHRSSNMNLREQLAVLYARMLFDVVPTLGDGPAGNFDFGLVQRQCVSLLSDGASRVREAALDALAVMTAMYGDDIVQQLQGAGVRQSHLQTVQQRAAELREEDVAQPAAAAAAAASAPQSQHATLPPAAYGRADPTPGSEHPSSTGRRALHGLASGAADGAVSPVEVPPAGRGHFATLGGTGGALAASTSAAEGATAGAAEAVLSQQHSGPFWRPGVLGFSTELVGTAKPLALTRPAQLQDILDTAGSTLASISLDWKARLKSLEALRGLVSGGVHRHETLGPMLLAGIRAMRASLGVQTGDLRSSIVKAACLTIAELSAAYTAEFEGVAEALVAPLLKGVVVTKEVISHSCHAALASLLHNTVSGFPRVVPRLVTGVGARHHEKRRRAGTYLAQILRGWSTPCLARHTHALAAAIAALAEDADGEARACGRIAFWSFLEHFPDQGDAVLGSLTAATQEYVQGAHDEAVRAAAAALREPVVPLPGQSATSGTWRAKGAAGGAPAKGSRPPTRGGLSATLGGAPPPRAATARNLLQGGTFSSSSSRASSASREAQPAVPSARAPSAPKPTAEPYTVPPRAPVYSAPAPSAQLSKQASAPSLLEATAGQSLSPAAAGSPRAASSEALRVARSGSADKAAALATLLQAIEGGEAASLPAQDTGLVLAGLLSSSDSGLASQAANVLQAWVRAAPEAAAGVLCVSDGAPSATLQQILAGVLKRQSRGEEGFASVLPALQSAVGVRVILPALLSLAALDPTGLASPALQGVTDIAASAEGQAFFGVGGAGVPAAPRKEAASHLGATVRQLSKVLAGAQAAGEAGERSTAALASSVLAPLRSLLADLFNLSPRPFSAAVSRLPPPAQTAISSFLASSCPALPQALLAHSRTASAAAFVQGAHDLAADVFRPTAPAPAPAPVPAPAPAPDPAPAATGAQRIPPSTNGPHVASSVPDISPVQSAGPGPALGRSLSGFHAQPGPAGASHSGAGHVLSPSPVVTTSTAKRGVVRGSGRASPPSFGPPQGSQREQAAAPLAMPAASPPPPSIGTRSHVPPQGMPTSSPQRQATQGLHQAGTRREPGSGQTPPHSPVSRAAAADRGHFKGQASVHSSSARKPHAADGYLPAGPSASQGDAGARPSTAVLCQAASVAGSAAKQRRMTALGELAKLAASTTSSADQEWATHHTDIVSALLAVIAGASAGPEAFTAADCHSALAALRRMARSRPRYAVEHFQGALQHLVAVGAFAPLPRDVLAAAHRTAAELAQAVAQQESSVTLSCLVDVLCAFERGTGEATSGGDHGASVAKAVAGLKVLRSLVAASPAVVTRAALLNTATSPVFLSGVRNAFLSTASELRKNLTLTLADIALALGTEAHPTDSGLRCCPALDGALQAYLTASQVKLVRIYIHKHASAKGK